MIVHGQSTRHIIIYIKGVGKSNAVCSGGSQLRTGLTMGRAQTGGLPDPGDGKGVRGEGCLAWQCCQVLPLYGVWCV